MFAATLRKDRMGVPSVASSTHGGILFFPLVCYILLTLVSWKSSDVLRRHEKSHHDLWSVSGAAATSFPTGNDSMLLTPSPQTVPNTSGSLPDQSVWMSHPPVQTPSDTQQVSGMTLHDSVPNGDSSWSLGTDLDVDALDFSLSSAISEWARLPPAVSNPGSNGGNIDLTGSITAAMGVFSPRASHNQDAVQGKWFNYLSPSDEPRAPRLAANAPQGSTVSRNLDADESYRAGLSRELQPRTYDEALPSAEQLNLYAKLFFSRFHSLFPVIHAPTFRPTAENSLLFLSICSIGSLFVGSSYAVAQGTRIFERLNKAILASWENILSRSRPDALSMVQAAILGQTFGILSGRPKDLVLADVLHGTVMSWARESNKYSNVDLRNTKQISLDTNPQDLEVQWQTWIEVEQRGRVELALNIHDAELAGLLHHDPLRRHRFSDYPHLESDLLFAAPTAIKWAALYQQRTTPGPYLDSFFWEAGLKSRFAAYSVLESVYADVTESRNKDDREWHQEIYALSDCLVGWWQTHMMYLQDDEDPFGLPVLWHSIYMSLYVDMDLLEQAIGRNGNAAAMKASEEVQKWATSLDASKCLVHALLIQRYLERMRVSAEPAIHIPRALFSAALAWLCFNRIGHQQEIDLAAFEAPEIKLLGSKTALQEAQGQAFGDSAFADVNHLHRLVDLLHRVGRWGITKTFATVLSAAMEDGRVG